MFMLIIKILALAVPMLISAWSLFLHTLRRLSDKLYFKEFSQNAPVFRVMTQEEADLAQRFLLHRPKPLRRLKLKSRNVYMLEGAYLRYGLTTSAGIQSNEHETLGKVEIALPYDAANFIRKHNKAEVVLTNRCAVVIKLNGVFDLAGGQAREQRQKNQDAQWQRGEPGLLDGRAPEQSGPDEAKQQTSAPEFNAPKGKASATSTPTDPIEAALPLPVYLLGQRQETPAEIVARQRPKKWGTLAALAWLGAFALAWQASKDQAGLVAPAVLCAGLASWLAWHKPALTAAQQVNHVRGELILVEKPDAPHTGPASLSYFLGYRMSVVFPEHWQKALGTLKREPLDWNMLRTLNIDTPLIGKRIPVDLDVRVSDRAVLRMGKAYSIDAEMRRHPWTSWTHHATLAGLGLLMTCIAPAWMPDIRLDAQMALSWLLAGEQARVYDSADALAADPPAVGREIIVSGAARCALVPMEIHPPQTPSWWGAITFAKMDCTQLRWGGPAPQLDEIDTPRPILSLYRGEFIHASLAPSVAASTDNGYQQQPALIMRQLGETIMAVNETCMLMPSFADRSCDDIKARVVRILNSTGADPIPDWAAALKLAQDGKLSGDRDRAVLNRLDFNNLALMGRYVANVVTAASIGHAAQKALADQHGTWLAIQPGPQTRLPPMRAIAKEAIPSFWDDPASKFLAVWTALQRSAGEERAFHVQGVITSKEQSADGALKLTIDGKHGMDNAVSVITRCLTLAAAIALMLVHGGLCLIRLRTSMKRRTILCEEAITSARVSAFL